MYWLECISCGKKYDKDTVIYQCDCGSILDVKYDKLSGKVDGRIRRGIWRYRHFLPIEDWDKIVSLNEGNTTLHECKNLNEKIGCTARIHVKNEGENPTGSFKDRGMTVGITRALELGMRRVGCASTGNTSASLAAYAAKAGIECVILVPSGKIAYGKMAQALAYGAKVYAIKGNFDDAMARVKKMAEQGSFYLLNSINPYRLEGQKTLAYEIVDEIGRIDKVFIPVGNAGNISAVWKGLREYKQVGKFDELPNMIGVQAEGACPIYNAFLSGTFEPVKNPETVASAIRIGNPVSWRKALNAVKESGGEMLKVSDEEILQAQALLARSEGIFVEPASAASIAGLLKFVEAGKIEKKERVVCITTGNGLKDPDTVVNRYKSEIKEVDAEAIMMRMEARG